MYHQIIIKRDKGINCPLCKDPHPEWVGGKVDSTEQECICRKCRITFKIYGWSEEDQETIADEAFN